MDRYALDDKVIAEIPELLLLDAPGGDVDDVL
jgi:hypothetical protein